MQNTIHPKRQHWLTVDDVGVFTWIAISDLRVDDTYQRREAKEKAREIAKKWSWAACGAISVAERTEGFFVIDGQHRVAAAKLKSIAELPCMVFVVKDLKEEATGFLNANTNRKPITAVQRHRAMLTAEDPIAAHVERLALRAGRIIGDGEHEIGCVTAIRRCLEIDAQALEEVWDLVVTISMSRRFHVRILESLHYIQCKGAPARSLNNGAVKKRFTQIGYDRLVEAAGRAAAFYASGGTKVWAIGICQEYNKGLRTSKINISGHEV